MPQSNNFFITGHKGFETALFHEVRDILQLADNTPERLSKVYGGVEVEGHIELAYRLCIHSRLANRVYLQLATFKADNEETLYQQVYAIDWSQHLSSRHSFAVSASLSRSAITHSHYASLKVKDAVVDKFRDTVNARPMVEKEQPDIRIHLNLHKNRATLSLDLSGQSLHRRGYRTQHSGAPLKEHLAAALLSQAGWTADSATSHSLIDPMCGSGTFVIEAAMIAAGIAAGLERKYFGFLRWIQHDSELWRELLDEAEQKRRETTGLEIIACDNSQRSVDIARDNARRAGVEELITFKKQDIEELSPDMVSKPALIILNPPYGERLQVEEGLARLYSTMGRVFSGFEKAAIHIISANPDLLHRLRLNRVAKKNVNNGPLACVFASFDSGGSTHKAASSSPGAAVDENDPETRALANRLTKNHKHLSRWARRNGVDCFRLYDADLPEFSFALDVYTNALNPEQRWFHLQEYQAPKTVDANRAAQRIELAQKLIRKQFSLREDELFSKLRQRQRGTQQYEKQGSEGELFQVREGSARLLVNLTDYLDSGLFLDHRPTRERVTEHCSDKSLLNLFCYTASVSVQAALGGASSVVSVDMSKTYINWARENFELNGLTGEEYRFIEADCLALLQKPTAFGIRDGFDQIFLDPPSFSNSKKMRDTLDVQRDHERLIEQAMKLLNPDGILYFSTNRKGFKLAAPLGERFIIKDITAQTIPEDFKRRPKIHQCWEISRKS